MNEFKTNLEKIGFTAYLYYIEFQVNGKQYVFRSCEKLNKEDFVICDSEFGKAYGKVKKIKTIEAKIVDFEVFQLFDENFRQTYKQCWKA